MLLECRDWSGFQFMETSTKRGCQFHVLHRLADRAALDSATTQALTRDPLVSAIEQKQMV